MNFNDDKISSHMNDASKKAEDYLRDKEKSKKLLEDSEKKYQESKGNQYIRDVWDKLSTLFRLFRSYINGEYTKTPWQFLIMIVAALIYFFSPIDAIPDLIPVLGFADDATVIAVVFNSIKPVLDDFITWEKSKKK